MNLKHHFFILTLLLVITSCYAQKQQIAVLNQEEGMKLVVDGKDFFIHGMNWDYYPIGTNYTYSLWEQTDTIIEAALEAEMSLLKEMGVNAIRQYTGVPAKWIQYIYEKYGIYTMLNHSFGRYGVLINGTWVAHTDYANAETKNLLLSEVKTLAEEYKNTPGLLLYLLGNENNYGLFWDGAETEDIPVENKTSTARATALYQLFNEAVIAMKAVDTSHPIAICNGDLQFLELIIEHCTAIDILGTNMYRGVSFGDAFQKVKRTLNKPLLFTEFGGDAYNAIKQQEDQAAQAYYMLGNWKEIYENAAGLGKADNCIGGFTFQFSDGWWKYGQTINLKVHDTNASWANGGYIRDLKKGKNNMNEEWFGVCAKGPTQPTGLYTLHPRTAYYVLKKAHILKPYTDDFSLKSINKHFENIQIKDVDKK